MFNVNIKNKIIYYLFVWGEMSERFKEHAWKACIGETLSGVRIPLSPPVNLSVLDGELAVPCNLQSATAGLNSLPRLLTCGVWPVKVVLITGSHATKIHKLRQIRKEAAVSEHFRVTWINLVWANYTGNAHKLIDEARCTVYNLRKF